MTCGARETERERDKGRYTEACGSLVTRIKLKFDFNVIVMVVVVPCLYIYI